MKERADMQSPKMPRRSLLMTASFGLIGAAGLYSCAKLGGSLSPTADVRADMAQHSMMLDLAIVPEGETRIFVINTTPYNILHRTALQISADADDAALHLTDPLARNANLPQAAKASDINRRATPDGRFVIVELLCTYRGCVPVSQAGDFGGWFCPCCSAHYDRAGRIRKGIAPHNMAIPRMTVLPGQPLKIVVLGNSYPGPL